MTTSVDILFKELPAAAKAQERKNVSDISSTAQAGGNNEVRKSKKTESTDKTFAEHLDEQNVQTTENKSEANEKVAAQESETLSDQEPGKAQENNADNFPGTTSYPSPDQNAAAINVDKASELNSKITVVPDENSEKKNDPQQPNVDSVVTKSNNIDEIIVASEQSGGKNEKSNPQALPIAKAESDAVDNIVVQETGSPAKTEQKVPEETAKTVNVVVSPANSDEPALVTETTNDKRIAETSVKAETQHQANADTQSNDNKTQNIIENTDVNISQAEGGKKASETLNNTSDKSIASQDITTENVPQNNTEIGEAVSPSSEQNAQSPIRSAETMSTEAAKSIPVAQAPTQHVVNKPTAAAEKNNIKSAAAKADPANDQTPKASINANAGQPAASANNTNLTSAFKSDIQLDLGSNGQKSEPAPLLPPLQNNPGQLTSNSLLAIQDIAQHKTIGNIHAAMKTDAAAMTRMINEQITVAINRQIVNGQNNFTIRLQPAELGQVDIRLEFAKDGKMQASMVVENERTLTMLQRDQGALEKALQDAGINMSNKNMNFSLMKQDGKNAGQQFAGNNNSTGDEGTLEQLSQQGTMQQVSMGYSNQALDISV